MLPDFRFTPIKEGLVVDDDLVVDTLGIKQAVEWFQENYSTARK